MGIFDFFKKNEPKLKEQEKKGKVESDEVQTTRISVMYQLVLKDKSVDNRTGFKDCSNLREQTNCNSNLETDCVLCKKLVELNKYYTRKDIESMTQKFGYSVFDNPGGAVDNEGNPICQYKWENVILTQKI